MERTSRTPGRRREAAKREERRDARDACRLESLPLVIKSEAGGVPSGAIAEGSVTSIEIEESGLLMTVEVEFDD